MKIAYRELPHEIDGWPRPLLDVSIGDKALGVAGSGTKARMVPTLLTVGDHSWEAEVGFCDPWPHGWGLLGQLSFFRYFVVTFRAVDFELEINDDLGSVGRHLDPVRRTQRADGRGPEP